MKVLLRQCYSGAEYVWKEAEYKDGYFYVDGEHYYESNIVSITDDDRGDKVKCSACKKIFTKDSPEIEVHKNRYKDINTCFKCGNLYAYASGNETVRYEIDGDVYKKVRELPCTLYCSKAWPRGPIGSERAQNNCYAKPCADAQMVEISDIFTQNPGIFDDITTVDKLLEVGYREKMNDNIYRLHGRNKIEVYVNNIGIVDHFIVTYYGNSWCLVYSKKLDKLFITDHYKYAEWNPGLVSESTNRHIKNRIAALYN